jgi:hypothetical protein
MVTYVKRTYHPFLLREPRVWQQQQQQEEGSALVGATWAYDDPAWAGTAKAQPMAGCMVALCALADLPAAVAAAAQQLQALEVPGGCGVLHVAVSGGRWGPRAGRALGRGLMGVGGAGGAWARCCLLLSAHGVFLPC